MAKAFERQYWFAEMVHKAEKAMTHHSISCEVSHGEVDEKGCGLLSVIMCCIIEGVACIKRKGRASISS